MTVSSVKELRDPAQAVGAKADQKLLPKGSFDSDENGMDYRPHFTLGNIIITATFLGVNTFALCLVAGILCGTCGLEAGQSTVPPRLDQEVYVWQRTWAEPVRRAVLEHGAAFERIVILTGEVTWRNGKPALAEVRPDYQTLARAKRPIGLALRVGPYSGGFSHTNPAIAYLASLSSKLIVEAREAGVTPSELQIDFDCASSKLDGYRVWVKEIRARVVPVPVVVTALPTWLDEPAFLLLARAADGYVLQVHSLERPKSFDTPFTLCHPASARRAVAKAGQIGRPFRVALPTYGYTMAFDGKDRFIGLSAEGPARSWPAGARIKEVRADPLQMAQLVQEWSSNAPPALKGFLWYRLPVPGDTLNWRWPTLNAILQTRIPRQSVRAEAHRVEPGLTEIGLVNDGELDISSRLAIKARWTGARLMSGDGLSGFEVTERAVFSATIETGVRPYLLPAGERRVSGWLRLSEDREVQVELEELDGP